MAKPYRIICVYNSGANMREKLKALGVEFKERDFLSDFWGKEFTIQKPKAKRQRRNSENESD